MKLTVNTIQKLWVLRLIPAMFLLTAISCGSGNSSSDGNQAPLKIVQTVTGGSHSCGLLNDGSVRCWGDNISGQLGLGDKQPRGSSKSHMGKNLEAANLGRPAIFLSAGGNHTCAVLNDYSIKCWGVNAQGELGLGDTDNRGDDPNEMGVNLSSVDLGTNQHGDKYTAITVATGNAHSCALLDDYSVKCWGSNVGGRLGLGETYASRGGKANEMGDFLPKLKLGTASGAELTASMISAGYDHSCALLVDKTLKCWGQNHIGQLGLGDKNNRGENPSEMGDALPRVDLGTDLGGSDVQVSQISAGAMHSCALLESGALKCWGENNYGQLGIGSITDHGGNPNEMGDNLPAVVLGRLSIKALAVTAGTSSSCAILNNGSPLKCWGYNGSGQLGQGNDAVYGWNKFQTIKALPAIQLGIDVQASTIGLGGGHACALLNNYTTKCWGANTQGQLGLGDVEPRGDNSGEMGGDLPEVLLF